ncbi:hypothetical protein ACFL0F_02495 [Patescibacteria group bacterium]
MSYSFEEKVILDWWLEREFYPSDSWFSPQIKEHLIKIGIPKTRWLKAKEIIELCNTHDFCYINHSGSGFGKIYLEEPKQDQTGIGWGLYSKIGISYKLIKKVENQRFVIKISLVRTGGVTQPNGVRLKFNHLPYTNSDLVTNKFSEVASKHFKDELAPLDSMPNVAELPIPIWVRGHSLNQAFCTTDEFNSLTKEFIDELNIEKQPA